MLDSFSSLIPFGPTGTFIVIVLVIAFIALAVLSPSSKTEPRYTRLDTLFSPAEHRFLKVLLQTMPSQVLVFGKVRVADVLTPRKYLDRRQWNQQFCKISSKHFDFVLIDRNTARLLCAIELDDRSHKRSDRVRRDHFLNAACQSAGFPLLRWPVKSHYDRNEIRRRIADALSPNAPDASS